MRSKKLDFMSDFTVFQVIMVTLTKVKGHLGHGHGQRSRASRSKVKWVKPCLKVMILAGGLTSTSSCIFNGQQGCHGHGKVMGFLEFLEKSWKFDQKWTGSWKSHGIFKLEQKVRLMYI